MKTIIKFVLGFVAAIFIIIFDGRKEAKQLTDREERAEVGDEDEIQEINPQAIYAGESESQENMGLNGKNANMDDDIDSIEKINKYMIPGHVP